MDNNTALKHKFSYLFDLSSSEGIRTLLDDMFEAWLDKHSENSHELSQAHAIKRLICEILQLLES